MSSLSINAPFPIFTDVDGNALESGYIYIGSPGLNPEPNPAQTYWDPDLTIPAAQPIRTIGGYPSRSGSPGRLYIEGADYSILVRNKNGSLLYSSLTVTERTTPASNDITAFGADANSTDNSAAINAAIAAGFGQVLIPDGVFICLSPLVLKAGVSIIGTGKNKSVIDYRGINNVFVANEPISFVEYNNFGVTNANNTNGGVDAMVFNYGCSRSLFRIKYTGKGGDTSDGIVIHGTANGDGVTANNNQYGCLFDCNMTVSGTEINGAAIKLFGTDVVNSRANAHDIYAGTYDGFATGIYVNGNGNRFGAATINGPASVAGIHIYGNGSYGNIIDSTYLDSAITGDQVRLESTVPNLYMLTVAKTVSNNWLGVVVDRSSGGNSAIYEHIGGVHKTMNNDFLSNPTSACGWFGQKTDGALHVMGGPEATSGGFAAASAAFSQQVNKLAWFGGASAVINKHGAADFRVVNTSNGSSYGIPFSVGMDGVLRNTASVLTKTLGAFSTIDGSVASTSHGLVTGQGVTFRQTGGADPTGISSGTKYYAIIVDANTLKLASSLANAVAGTAIVPSTAGSGTLTLVTGAPIGTFTMAAANSLTIDNAGCNSGGTVLLIPTNAAAATLMQGTKSLYVTINTGRFTVATADATAAAGTETFKYLIIG